MRNICPAPVGLQVCSGVFCAAIYRSQSGLEDLALQPLAFDRVSGVVKRVQSRFFPVVVV